MLSLRAAFNELQNSLLPLYDGSEATAIAHEVLEAITGKGRLQRMMDKDLPLTDTQQATFARMGSQLLTGRPMQYALGFAHFFGRNFTVNESVLIPRPETEGLVQWMLYECKADATKTLLDIGTGSGCIPITLKLGLPEINVYACDISPTALAIATQNAKTLQANISFFELDILNPQPHTGKYDCIVSNPPYIPQREVAEMHNNVTQHEPHLALFVPDNEPLLFYKAITAFGKQHLNAGGKIYCELHRDYGKETVDWFQKEGYQDIVLRKDMSGNDRMLCATLM